MRLTSTVSNVGTAEETPAMIHTCILAASRHELLRSLKRALEPDLEIVGMVDNPVSLRDAMLALEPDLVVVDLDFLGSTPWNLVSTLRSRSPEVGVILLTEGDEPRVEEGARGAGVDRMVLRRRVASELVSAAREVLGRGAPIREGKQGTLK